MIQNTKNDSTTKAGHLGHISLAKLELTYITLQQALNSIHKWSIFSSKSGQRHWLFHIFF